MRTSLYVVIALSFFAVVSAAGRKKKDYGHPSKAYSSAQPFSLVVNTDLQKICEGTIVGDFQNWFNGWIIRNLLNRPFASPRATAKAMKEDIDGHLALINAYVKSFLDKTADLPKFGNLYFDVEVKDLVSRVNEVLAAPIENPYDSPEHIDGLAPQVGPYAQEVVDAVAKPELTLLNIENIGNVFKEEDLAKEEVDQPLRLIIEENKNLIIPTLKRILKLAANEPANNAYANLPAEDKKTLQKFFDKFKYLLTPDEHRKTVIEALTHVPEDKAVKNHPFIGSPLLNELASVDSDFQPTFYRDEFIVEFDPQHTLDQLNDASKDVFFSWPFFEAFDRQSYDNFVNKADKTTNGKNNRKAARLHHMLYKVYTFARNDRTLLPGDDKEMVPILRKLYKWVLDTKMFDAPIVTDDGVINDGKKLHVLFPPIKFKRYFLPLLQLICSKIPGCDLLKEDKAKVVDKFVAFGNHDELKAKKNVASLIPVHILDAIMEDAGVQLLKDFGDELDALISPTKDKDEEPEDVDQVIFDEDPHQDFDFERNPADDDEESPIKIAEKGKSPEKERDNVMVSEKLLPTAQIFTVKAKKPKLGAAKKLDDAQENFDKKIGEKFLPTKDGELDPKKEAQLAKFIDTIESTEDPKKKNTMRNLLIKFIYKSFTANKPQDPKAPNPVTKLVNKANDHLHNRLRGMIDYDATLPFRNFLFRTMQMEDKYNPETGDDEFNYEMDVAYFIRWAEMDKLAAIKKEKGESAPEFAAFKKTMTDTAQSLQKLYLMGGSKDRQGMRVKSLKRDLIENPLHLERAAGVEFFKNFIDFFKYYEIPTGNKAEAVNVDYYRVYLQFYQVLSHIRRNSLGAIDNPHEYVLRKMEHCMTIAEAQQSFVNTAGLQGSCLFSYRKYAEILMFYKTYLLATKKNVKLELQGFAKGDKFNVHTRMFLVFASANPQYANLLNINCETLVSEPICVSWKLYNEVLSFIRFNEMSVSAFNQRVEKISALTDIDSRLNMYNGVEAAYFHNKRASMVNWEKALRVLDTYAKDETSGLAKVLKFKEGDEQKLARYLIRTFKKLSLSPQEVTLAKVVTDVMETPENADVHKDSLSVFLLYNERIVPFFIKLFLQFSTKDQHFLRIAKLLIKSGISSDLIMINDIDKDNFFQSFAVATNQMTQEQAHKHIYTTLQGEYQRLLGECNAIAANTVNREVADNLLFDPFEGLDEVQEEQEETIKVEQKAAEKVLQQIAETSTRIQISADTNLDLVKEELKKNAIRSNLDPNFNGEIDVQVVEEETEEIEDDGDEEFEEVDDVTVNIETEGFQLKVAQEIAEKASANLMAKLDEIMKKENAGDINDINVSHLENIQLPTPEVASILKRKMEGPAYNALILKLKAAQKSRRKGAHRAPQLSRQAKRERRVNEAAQRKAQKSKDKNHKNKLMI